MTEMMFSKLGLEGFEATMLCGCSGASGEFSGISGYAAIGAADNTSCPATFFSDCNNNGLPDRNEPVPGFFQPDPGPGPGYQVDPPAYGNGIAYGGDRL